MDFLTGMRVASSGMTAQRMRINSITSNIANINSTQSPEGGPYRRKDVVFEAIPDGATFSQVLNAKGDGPDKVIIKDIISDQRAPLLKYEPDHVDADENGYVAYPNINMVEEWTNMIQANRAYEANVSAMNATKDMALKSLEIGQ